MAGKSGRSGRWAQWSKYISNADELEKIMSMGCKGSVTELTKVAARILYEETYKAFGPGAENHLKYKDVRESKVKYPRTGTIANTISIEKTVRGDDSFTNKVYFDEDKIHAKQIRRTNEYLPRYDSVGKDEFDAEEYISALEDGTEISDPRMHKFSRKEAGFVKATRERLEDFINGAKMNSIVEEYVEKKVGRGFEITRHK